MDGYFQLIQSILAQQKLVLGEQIAMDLARRVAQIQFDASGRLTGVSDGFDALKNLIEQYRGLLGPAAESFAKDAARDVLKEHPELRVPEVLQI